MNHDTSSEAIPLSVYEPTFVIFERHTPDAIAIRFDGEWITIEKGSLRWTLDTFACTAKGGGVIAGKSKHLCALRFEAVES